MIEIQIGYIYFYSFDQTFVNHFQAKRMLEKYNKF